MKSNLLLFILLLSISFSYAQVNSAQPIDGTDCSNLFFKSIQERDARTLDMLMKNDFTVTSFNGQIIQGEQLKQAIAEGYLSVESGMLSGANTRNYGDVAVVTGQWNIRARLENNSFQGDLTYMTICVRSGGKWQVSAVQLTPLL